MEKSLAQGWIRVIHGMRALVRQLVAAVYVVVAAAFVAMWVSAHPTLAEGVQPAVTLLGGFIVGLVITGPWWTTHLVGLFAALVRSGFAIGFQGLPDTSAAKSIAILIVVTSLAGAAGARAAVIVRHKRA